MTSGWPANRGKKTFFDELTLSQQLKITCGVEGCSESFKGELRDVLPALAEHRSRSHPHFVPPTKKRRSTIGSRKA